RHAHLLPGRRTVAPVDTLHQGPDLPAVPAKKHRLLGGKIRLGHAVRRIHTAEAHPNILPRLLCVGTVVDGRVGIDQEGIAGFQLIPLVPANVHPFSPDHMVQQEMVSYTGSPAVAGGTLLTTGVLYIQGRRSALKFHGVFVDAAVSLAHCHHPFPQSWHPRAGPARRLVASFVSVSLCFIIHDYLAICLYSL